MLKVLDLFAGIGGFSLGLERTGGFETIGFCEVDKKAQAVLKKHWPEVPIYDDVTKLTKDDIDGTVDVITGGFPCQDISLAGKGAGLEGERSGLWWEYHRLIKELQPKWVIAENVSALRSRGLDQVLRSLSEIGYDAEWHCIPASAVGAPHRRDRVWIVAYPQLHGLTSSSITRSLEEAIRQESTGKDNSFNTEGTSSVSTSSEAMAYPNNQRPQGWIHRWKDQEREAELGHFGCGSAVHRQSIKDFWAVEPNVGRVAHGVPKRVDRIKQLGNAVVPQIPELIGRVILNN
jgi:DNA (cytosine-5)-methyltransferase 1